VPPHDSEHSDQSPKSVQQAGASQDWVSVSLSVGHSIPPSTGPMQFLVLDCSPVAPQLTEQSDHSVQSVHVKFLVVGPDTQTSVAHPQSNPHFRPSQQSESQSQSPCPILQHLSPLPFSPVQSAVVHALCLTRRSGAISRRSKSGLRRH